MTCFTPVHIQAVHSNLFHQHRQGENETVDQYARKLHKLFYKAYPKTGQHIGKAERFGRVVLAYQFVADFILALGTKVTGVEGNFA